MAYETKILVKGAGGAGDCLLTTPVLAALREKFPQAAIHMVTNPVGREVLGGLNMVQRFIVLPDFFKVMAYTATGYDRVITLRYERHPHLHIVDAYYLTAGIAPVKKTPIYYVPEDERRWVREKLRQTGIKDSHLVVAVHRGPTWPNRSWPDNYFKIVMEYLVTKWRAVIVELSDVSGYYLGYGLDFTGKTTYSRLAATLERAGLFFGVDSMPMHMAGAVGTPVVALFGAVDPDKRIPLNDISVGVQVTRGCRGCHHRRGFVTYSQCIHRRISCMEDLSPYRAIFEIERMLDRKLYVRRVKNL